MRITDVVMSGFREADGKQSIAARQAFAGKNGSGKSRVLDAIRYVLTGRLGESKKNEAIFSEYASSYRMECSLVFDTCVTVRRGIERGTNSKGDTAYSSDCIVFDGDGPVVSGVKAVNQWLEENIPVPDIVLMFSEFDSMKTTERRKLLLEYVPYEEPDVEEIADYAHDSVIDGLDDEEDPGEDFYEILGQITDQLKKCSNLSDMQEEAERQRAYSLKMHKDGDGAKVVLAKMKNQMDSDNASFEELEDALNGYAQDEIDLNRDLGKSEEIERQTAERKVEIEALSNSESIEHIIEEHQMATTTLNEINERLEEIDKEKPVYPEELLRPIAEEREKIMDQVTDLRNQRARIPSLFPLEDDYRELVENLDGISDCQCPYTKTVCPAGEDALKLGLEQQKIVVMKRIDELKKQDEVLRDKICPLTQKDSELGEQYSQILAEHEKAVIRYKDAFALEIQQAELRQQNISFKVDQLDKQIAQHVEKEKRRAERLAELKAVIPPAHEDPEKIKRRIKVVSDKQVEIGEQLDAIRERATVYEMQNKAAVEADTYEIKHRIWKAIKASLGVGGILGDLIKKSSKDFIELMDNTLAMFGRREKFFIDMVNDQGKEILRFGWWRGGKQINFASMSNGERTILAICMCYAFQVTKNLPFSLILIDDTEKLDAYNIKCVYEGLSQLNVNTVVLAGLNAVEFKSSDFVTEVL